MGRAAAAEVRSSIVAVGWYDDTLLVETLRTVEEVLGERDPRIIETEGGVDGLLIDSAIVHDVFCRNLQGYLQRLFELVGAKDVTVGHPECRVQGGALCRFAIRWA